MLASIPTAPVGMRGRQRSARCARPEVVPERRPAHGSPSWTRQDRLPGRGRPGSASKSSSRPVRPGTVLPADFASLPWVFPNLRAASRRKERFDLRSGVERLPSITWEVESSCGLHLVASPFLTGYDLFSGVSSAGSSPPRGKQRFGHPAGRERREPPIDCRHGAPGRLRRRGALRRTESCGSRPATATSCPGCGPGSRPSACGDRQGRGAAGPARRVRSRSHSRPGPLDRTVAWSGSAESRSPSRPRSRGSARRSC